MVITFGTIADLGRRGQVRLGKAPSLAARSEWLDFPSLPHRFGRNVRRERDTGDTMRYMVVLAAILATSGLELRSVQADTLKYSTVGPWTIAVDPSSGNGCFVVANFKDGTGFRLGFDLRKSAGTPFYILLGNVKWRSIEYGKKYPIKMRFGNQPAWTGNASGFSFDPPENQTWLRLGVTRKTGVEFITEYMREKFVAVDYNEKEILRLSLKDSFRAGLNLLECQKATNTEKQDPFKDASSSSKEDPFR